MGTDLPAIVHLALRTKSGRTRNTPVCGADGKVNYISPMPAATSCLRCLRTVAYRAAMVRGTLWDGVSP